MSLTDTTYSFSDSRRLLEEYLGWRGRPNHPPSVVPLLTWGCAIWSLVDYSTPEGRMWGWDPNARCPEHGHALFPKTSHWPNGFAGGWTDARTFRRHPLVRTAQIVETAALLCGCIPVAKLPGTLRALQVSRSDQHNEQDPDLHLE